MPSLRRSRLAGAWPFLLFVAIIAFLFPEVIFQGKTFLGDFDRWVIQMPLQLLAARSLRHGMLPFWDAYTFCGQFALGQANMTLLYPPNFLIMWLLPSHVPEATSIRILVEGFLAMSLFYVFFMKVFSDRLLAVFASLTFCLSTGLVISYNVGHSPQWFTPLLLLAIWDWRGRDLRRNALFLSAALFLHLSGGYLQHTTYVIAIAFLISFFRELRRPDWKEGLPRLLLLWGVSMAAAVMLDSFELTGMVDAQRLSNRVTTTYPHYLHLWGVSWPAALRLVFPRFLGDYHDFFASYTAFNHDEAFPAYAGLAAFFFTAVAALRACEPEIFPWLAMGVFLALASLNTPMAAVPYLLYLKAPLIHGRLARLVPLSMAFLAPAGIRSFSDGTRRQRTTAFALVCLLVLSLWYLAHGGLLARLLLRDELTELPNLPQRLQAASWSFLGGGALVIALLGARMAGLLSDTALKLGAVALLAADLTHSARVHTLPRVFVAEKDWYPSSPLTDFLRGLPDADDYNMEIQAGAFWPAPAFLGRKGFVETVDRERWASPTMSSFNPNVNIPYGLRNVGGYSNFINRRYSELVSRNHKALRGFREPLVRSPQVADALAVKYMVGLPTLSPYAAFAKPVFAQGNAVVYAKDNPVPRFHLACRAVIAPDDMEGFLGVLDSGRVDLHTVVLVPPQARFAQDFTSCRADPSAKLELRETVSGLLEGRASLSQPALLVLTQTYDPGWKAFINGREAPLQRANYAFQALELPAGNSTLTLRYRPVHYRLAAFATFLAAAFLAALGAYPLWRRR